jgi:hypothetical protein
MFTSILILILILILPVVCLPAALDTFFSMTDLDEMGICREGQNSNTLRACLK